MAIARVQTQSREINQLQQNIASAFNQSLGNLTGSFVFGVSGCTKTLSNEAKWQLSTQKGIVAINFPTTTGTSNTTACKITGLPNALFPPTAQAVLGLIYDNGTLAPGVINIGTDGSLSLYPTTATTAFTNSGTKGIFTQTIIYMLGI